MAITDILVKSKAVRRVIAVTAGAAVGVGTYFLASFVGKKIEERREEEIEWTDVEFPDIPEGVNEEDDSDEVPFDYVDRIVSEKYEKPDIVDYTKYSKVVASVLDGMTETADGDGDHPIEEFEENPACTIISEKEYLDTVSKFAKADATYFTKDKILAGWNEDLISRDISSTVGQKAIKAFDDPSVMSVYVRNTDLKVDYEIVRCDDLFDDVVQETVETEN